MAEPVSAAGGEPSRVPVASLILLGALGFVLIAIETTPAGWSAPTP